MKQNEILAITLIILITSWLVIEIRKNSKAYGEGFNDGMTYQKQSNQKHGVMDETGKWLDKYKLAK